MEGKICFLTPGQPSTNPRLVKEADALVEAGYKVHIICAHWVTWADKADKILLSNRSWAYKYVGGEIKISSLPYLYSRFRHGLSRRWIESGKCNFPSLRKWALSRVTPELEKEAKKIKADLYIAHTLAALPAAVSVAKKYNAYVGFDAEDYYSGMDKSGEDSSIINKVYQYFEQEYMPKCDYITTASPQIAEAYLNKYNGSIPYPIPILNVFPLSLRPKEFRALKEKGPLRLYWFSQTIGGNRGLEDVLRAMGILKNPNILLYLQGNWDKRYKNKFFHLVESVGIRKEQIIIIPPVSPGEIVRIAAKYDIGLALEQPICENRNICLTNKIFTYLLAGIAIIATATLAQKKIMEGIENAGLCYQPEDINKLAEYINILYHNRDLLFNMQSNSWEWGTKRFNWDIEKEKFLEVVRKTLEA